jgi:CRP/FNR family transcriptional regulator, nitrogen oxide reductase regulator
VLDVALISHLANFSDFSRQELAEFIAKSHAIRVPQNKAFFSEGEEAHSFFLLLDGHIRVVRTTASGEQVIIRYISSNDIFGIAKAVGQEKYPANAVAAVDCIALAWPTHMWDDTIQRFPSFGKSVNKAIGDRLLDIQERVIELATEQVEQRVALALLKLMTQTGKEIEDGTLIDMPLSRQDISEMTGTTLHTVSRLLSAWEQEGLVKSSRKKVVITNSQKLIELCRKG